MFSNFPKVYLLLFLVFITFLKKEKKKKAVRHTVLQFRPQWWALLTDTPPRSVEKPATNQNVQKVQQKNQCERDTKQRNEQTLHVEAENKGLNVVSWRSKRIYRQTVVRLLHWSPGWRRTFKQPRLNKTNTACSCNNVCFWGKLKSQVCRD